MPDTVSVKLPKRFYTVEQLAKRWDCNVEDISHLIEIDELKTAQYLAALHGKTAIRIQVLSDYSSYAKARDEANSGDTYDIVRWFNRLSKEEYAEYLLNELRDAQSEKKQPDNALDFDLPPNTPLKITPLPPDPTAADLAMLIGDHGNTYPETIGDAADAIFRELHEDGSYDPVITTTEVLRYELEHGEHDNSIFDNDLAHVRNRNTPDHPCYSEELSIAVEAWSELFADSDGKAPGKAPKKIIGDWLKSNYPKLGPGAIERISVLINPFKSGGATPTL